MSGSPVVTCLGQEGLKLKKIPFMNLHIVG